jgi:hypothetical protein
MNNHLNEDEWFERGVQGDFEEDFPNTDIPGSNFVEQPSILSRIYKSRLFRAAAFLIATSGSISYLSSLEVKQERGDNNSGLVSIDQERGDNYSSLVSTEQEIGDNYSDLESTDQERGDNNSGLVSTDQISQNFCDINLFDGALDEPLVAQMSTVEESMFITKDPNDSVEKQSNVIIRGADLSTVRSFAGTEDSLLSDSTDLTSLNPISNGQNAVVVTIRDGLVKRFGTDATSTRGDVFERDTIVTLTGRTLDVEFIEGESSIPATLVEVTYEGSTVYVIAGHLKFITNDSSIDSTIDQSYEPILEVIEEQAPIPCLDLDVIEGSGGDLGVIEGSGGDLEVAEESRPDLVREVIDAGSPIFLAFSNARANASAINNSEYSDLLSDILENADLGANAYGQSVYYANLLNDLFEGNLPVGSVINIGSAPYIVQRSNKQGLGRAIRQQMGYCETDIRRAWNEILDLASTYESSSGESLDIDASLREYEMPDVRAILRDIRDNKKSTDTGNETVDALRDFPNELIGLNVSYKSKRGKENTYIFKGVDENGNLELAPINSPNFIIRLKPATAALGNLGLIDNGKSIDRGIDDLDQNLVELCQDTTAENVEQALSS